MLCAHDRLVSLSLTAVIPLVFSWLIDGRNDIHSSNVGTPLPPALVEISLDCLRVDLSDPSPVKRTARSLCAPTLN